MKMSFIVLGKKIENYLVKEEQESDVFKTGIYKLVFVGSSNFYIGSTVENFKERYRRHLSDLINNRHCNNMLQSAYLKYGRPFLEIMEICDREECIDREQHYIDTLQPVYNICKIAGSTIGIKLSPEQIEKSSTKVDVFDLDGNFFNTYHSIAEACRQTGADASNVTKSMRTESTSSNNFQFRIHNKYTKIKPYEKSTCDRILCYNTNGEFLKEFPSKLSAAIELDVPVEKIVRNIRGRFGMTHGYIFKDYEKNYPLNIPKHKFGHIRQKSVKITDFYTKEVFEFNSFNKVPPEICYKSALTKGVKDFKGEDFIIKNRYIVQTKSYKTNDFISN